MSHVIVPSYPSRANRSGILPKSNGATNRSIDIVCACECPACMRPGQDPHQILTLLPCPCRRQQEPQRSASLFSIISHAAPIQHHSQAAAIERLSGAGTGDPFTTHELISPCQMTHLSSVGHAAAKTIPPPPPPPPHPTHTHTHTHTPTTSR